MMMNGFGFGFPFFMGGPFLWLIIGVAGYFIMRRFFNSKPNRQHASADRTEAYGRGQESVETSIYRLAAKLSGTITVSDVVTDMGIEPKKAEKMLESMADGVRIRMEVDDAGIVYYEFPELKPR
ncbi:MAG: hypothetical protein U5P10_11340 [Spirochaetia bacterium]|nr:hypothetical protein [Spirochaetia bacterium]